MTIVKCVVVGDGAVGKTSLLISYTTNTFPSEYVPAMFDHHDPPHVVAQAGSGCYTLALFDTLNHEDSDRLRPLAYPQTDVFLVCFRVTSPASYEKVTKKWFPEVHHHCPGVPCLLVGTQIDLRQNSQIIRKLAKEKQNCITREQGDQLARESRAVKYVECSALTHDGVAEVFEEAILAVIEQAAFVHKKGSCVIL